MIPGLCGSISHTELEDIHTWYVSDTGCECLMRCQTCFAESRAAKSVMYFAVQHIFVTVTAIGYHNIIFEQQKSWLDFKCLYSSWVSKWICLYSQQ